MQKLIKKTKLLIIIFAITLITITGITTFKTINITKAQTDTTPPTTPTNLTATTPTTGGSSQINLTWTASTDDTAVIGYNIYRCTGSSCTPTTSIGTSSTNSYSDTGLTAETTYTYAVSAYDGVPNTSSNSATASGTTQVSSVAVGVYQNFDELPVTGANEIPGDGGGWRYSSHITNTKFNFFGSCGWWNTQEYQEHPGIEDRFHLYKNSYNNPHMGYESFAFLEIDDVNAVRGHSLKATITGGKKDDGSGGVETHGLSLFTKEEYLTYINNGQNPVDSSEKVGNARLYLMNESYNHENYPIPAAIGANKLSYYVYLPQGLSNISGNDYWPAGTFNSAPFNHIGGHWYSDGYLNGGGWAHVIVDTHPQHNNAFSNAAAYPYPSYSLRAYDESFFDNLYAIYLSIGMYSGTAIPEYSIWFDEIEFINDNYYSQQNNETINAPSVMLHVATNTFELGWSGKYKNNGNSQATYEVRYSFTQITNENWDAATPVLVQDFPQFHISANTNGIVKKPSGYRQPVWLSFKILSGDESKLIPGATIYFAIKDVSQDPDNLQVPNPAYNNGRDYANHMSEFDFAGDAPALPLIKRIDYYIAGGTTDTTPPTISTPQPSTTLPAGTTSTTLSITTNENSTCKYSTTPNTAYASMTNTFSTTGGTSHSQTINNLTNESTYNYYIRCSDTSNNVNTTDTTITFNISTPITYNLSNFTSLVANWLGIGDNNSDVNNDGIVNTRDIGIMMSNWE